MWFYLYLEKTVNADYLDMLKCLNAAQVDYVMVGGWAVNLHGYIRATIDLDIWILADQHNAQKVFSALSSFGAPLQNVTPEDFAIEGTIFQIGVAPCRIDIINKIDGLTFSDASSRAVTTVIDGVPVRILSLDDLIVNKRASGRTKDLADAEMLEGFKK